MTGLRRPRALREGDTVALLAPAGPVPGERLDAGVTLLESWGLRVAVPDGARGRHPGLRYLAADDAQRARELAEAWLDPGVAAVIAALGGYGCTRLLELLDWDALGAAEPKLLIGSSDVTALHVALGARLGVASVFSTMPASAHFTEPAQRSLRAAAMHPGLPAELDGGAPLVPGTAHGVTAGGNLSLLAAGAGSPERRPPDGAIAVLEDVAEAPYRIDRMLTQLLREGWFAGVAGVAVGSWADCGPPEEVRSVLLDRLGQLGVPVADGLGFGHLPGAPAVPLGAPAELDATAGTLRVDPAVQ